MFNFYPRRIFLATHPVDMRKSFDTLAALVKTTLASNPYSGDAFLFYGKRKNRLKILFWEDSGFWLFSKRLEAGTFPIPTSDSPCFEMTRTQLQLFLDGIVVLQSKQLKRYKLS